MVEPSTTQSGLVKPALSQLSQSSPGGGETARRAARLIAVGQGRLELPTSRLSGVRSNHLSYWPDRPVACSVPGNRIVCPTVREFDLSVAPKRFLRKEVIQPQVPLRLPCYDFTPVTNHSLGACLSALRIGPSWLSHFWSSRLPWCDGRCVQGPGTYSPLPADQGLLAIPTSKSRVADSYPY